MVQYEISQFLATLTKSNILNLRFEERDCECVQCGIEIYTQIVYPTFIRPHLGFVSSVWKPHLEYDSKALKSFQRRATLTKRSRYKLVLGIDKVNWWNDNKILTLN